MTPPSFVAAITPPSDREDPAALVYAFRGRKLLVREAEGAAHVPRLGQIQEIGEREQALRPVRRLFLGLLGKIQIFAAEIEDSEVPAPQGTTFRGLRSLYSQLDEAHFNLAGRASQIVDWDRDHIFCSRCQADLEASTTERAKRCPHCKLVIYPRLSPAVIVLVERGTEILLARSPHFPPGMYSTLAGFVEPGETLEQTVIREIEEEVNIVVGDIRYFGSQPWPFPNSLMVGFHARYLGGEIKPKEDEIEDAGWFTASNLPKIPPKISIARALIDSFLGD